MTTRVTVKPELLRWACERAGRDVTHFARAFPRLADWVRGEKQPTLKQLDGFARATHPRVGGSIEAPISADATGKLESSEDAR